MQLIHLASSLAAASALAVHPVGARTPLIPTDATAQQGGAGIKVGDSVTVSTGFGWVPAVVVAVGGTNYRVSLVNGPVVVKTYPAEVRRKGPPTAYDRANGIYELHDRVQVNDQGRWIDARVITIMGMEYQVELPGNRTAWAAPSLLRFVSAEEQKVTAVAPAGQPPRAGLTSCAGKIEGRYAASNGMAYTMTFRSGKVKIEAPLMGFEEAECWTGDGKIVVHKAGEADDLEIDINDDGTLQTPFGEMKKKGK